MFTIVKKFGAHIENIINKLVSNFIECNLDLDLIKMGRIVLFLKQCRSLRLKIRPYI